MKISQIFIDQLRLLVATLPQVFKEDCFALKGGTAINLFIRPMPRLSVDIDLAYIPIEDRKSSLINIDAALRRIAANIKRYVPGSQITQNRMHNSQMCNRLLVSGNNARVKIEVTPVLRGSVNPPILLQAAPPVEELFGATKMRLLSFHDVYAGKICAALDRQHPRDLFDVKYLLDNEGITYELKNIFLVYLLSHNRPISELLDPVSKDLEEMYRNEFVGMTTVEASVEDLNHTRITLLERLHEKIDENDKAFLLSVKSGDPDWPLRSS